MPVHGGRPRVRRLPPSRPRGGPCRSCSPRCRGARTAAGALLAAGAGGRHGGRVPGGAAMTDLVVLSLERWDRVWRRNQHLVAGLLLADPDLRVLFVEPAADPTHDLASRRRPSFGSGITEVGAPAPGGYGPSVPRSGCRGASTPGPTSASPRRWSARPSRSGCGIRCSGSTTPEPWDSPSAPDGRRCTT